MKMSLNSPLLEVDVSGDESLEDGQWGVTDVERKTEARERPKFQRLSEKMKSAKNRFSMRTFFIVCLFLIAVTTVASVRDAGWELKAEVPVLRPRPASSSSSSLGYEQNSLTGSPPQFHNFRNYPWTFKCVDNKCQRQSARPEEPKVPFDVCWLTCGHAGPLWPVPAKVKLSQTTARFYPQNFFIREISGPTDHVKSLLGIAANITRQGILRMFPEVDVGYNVRRTSPSGRNDDGVPRYHSPDSTIVEVHLAVDEPTTSMTEFTDESYQMDISSVTMGTGALVNAKIKAATFFGARHALESLSQLVALDEPNQCLQVVDEVHIEDGPAYPIRGLMIDTARNFIPIENIYRMVDAMSYNKMNTLHWHLTDSNSFPFQSKSVPQMSQYGAYEPDKVYSIEQIRALVLYSLVRGVKIIPELDAPAHTGNGWQWGRQQGFGDLVVCVGKEPWRSYCGQPPCGQLNPTNENVFIILEKLYEELLLAFNTDVLHVGGDEVFPKCWEDIRGIKDWMRDHRLNSHVEVWGHFQNRAFHTLKKANRGNDLSAIVWSSGLTGSPVGKRFIDPQNFIVQIWEPSSSQQIKDLLLANYKVIFSNVDSMYLDMGGGTWLGTEHDYRFENWQRLYDNNLDSIVKNALVKGEVVDKHSKQVLGGIAPLWSEKVDENNMDVKLWPRGAAVAERLWTNPKERRDQTVYARLNRHTKRLKARGIRCSTLQPQSCLQMTGNCDDPLHHIKK